MSQMKASIESKAKAAAGSPGTSGPNKTKQKINVSWVRGIFSMDRIGSFKLQGVFEQ